MSGPRNDRQGADGGGFMTGTRRRFLAAGAAAAAAALLAPAGARALDPAAAERFIGDRVAEVTAMLRSGAPPDAPAERLAEPLAGRAAAQWRRLRVAALLPSQALGWIALRVDARVRGSALAIGVVATLLCGLAPAVSSSAVAPSAAIRDLETRVAGGKRRGRALSSLVVAEVTLAVVLLVGAGLMIQAFRALSRVDPGFRGDVLTFKISLPETAYPRRDDRDPLFLALRDRLAALPGIETAAIVTNPPLGGHTGFFFQAEDSILEEDDTPVVLTYNYIAAGLVDDLLDDTVVLE